MNKVHETDNLKNCLWKGPRYYDHPDGEDLLGKLSYTSKVGVAAGTIMGLFRAYVSAPPSSFPVQFLLFSRGFFPCVGMAGVFTVVTYFSTVIRKKDDEWNYILGGITAGPLMGIVHGSVAVAISTALACGAIGATVKSLRLQNIPLVGSSPQRTCPPYYSRNWDFSLERERKGNWTK